MEKGEFRQIQNLQRLVIILVVENKDLRFYNWCWFSTAVLFAGFSGFLALR